MTDAPSLPVRMLAALFPGLALRLMRRRRVCVADLDEYLARLEDEQ